MLKHVSQLLFQKNDYYLFPSKEYLFAQTKCFATLKSDLSDANGGGVKAYLTCSSV